MKTAINLLCALIMSCFVATIGNAQGTEVPTVHTSGDINTDIDVLLRPMDDFGADEVEIVRNLPLQAVPILTKRLNEANQSQEGRLMLLLVDKLRQFGNMLPASIKQPAIDALVAKCKSSNGIALRAHLALLKNIDDPRIDTMVDELSADQDESRRQAAATYKIGKRLIKSR